MKPIVRLVLAMSFTCFSGMLLASQALAEETHPKVLLKTNLGEIVVELYPEAAPKTVANFLSYVKSGHYNGTVFHRVINNFMVQGGGYDKKLLEKPTKKPIPLEAGIAWEKGLKNDLGTIAMARTDDPNSAAAQFFINVKDNEFLNHQVLPDGDPVTINRMGMPVTLPRSQAKVAAAGYTPFGKVVSGMDVVEKIKALETRDISPMFANLPIKQVVVESAKQLK